MERTDESFDPALDTELAARGLRCASRGTRVIAASVERIFENVLDWEHLPWLHAGAFASIDPIAAGASGWRARVTSRAASPRESVIEVRVDRDRLRYVSATVSGAGTGSEIWTSLSPVAPHRTRIDIAFWLPAASTDRLRTRGDSLLVLYERLWTEDEQMMVAREAELAAIRDPARRVSPAPERSERGRGEPERISLGSERELRSRLPVRVTLGATPYVVDEVDGHLVPHAARCPHLLGPLAVDPSCATELLCPWHGYRFDRLTGRSTDGRGLRAGSASLRIDPDTGHVWLERARGAPAAPRT